VVYKDRILVHLSIGRQAEIPGRQDLLVGGEASTKSFPYRVWIATGKQSFARKLGVGWQWREQRPFLLNSKALEQNRSHHVGPGIVAHAIEQPHEQPLPSLPGACRDRLEEARGRARVFKITAHVTADQGAGEGVAGL